MICDSCIVQLNVAYNFKMKAIESDTKLHQYAIEKGFGIPENSYNLAITDTTHSCNFIAPEPIQRAISHTVIQASENISTTAALQQEYLRHFETPQSMSSSRDQRPTSQNEKLNPASTSVPFRCMPIQIKVEPHDEYLGSSEVSPAASDENLQTVSDSSSIRSNENLSGSSMVCVNNKTTNEMVKNAENSSDKSFVNEYISSVSAPTKSSSDKSSSSVKTNSPQSDSDKDLLTRKRSLRSKEEKVKTLEEPKTKTTKRGRKRESDVLQNSFNTVKLGNKKPPKKDTKSPLMTTKSGRKISYIIDLNESKRNSRIRESQDRRRKEVKERLKGQTNKKTKT